MTQHKWSNRLTYTQRDRFLALAGIFQATHLVQQIARTGMVDQATFASSINSIFRVDVASPEDVYSGSENLQYGAKVLLTQLGNSQDKLATGKHKRDIEVTKYVINVLVLEKKLAKHPELLNKISVGVEKATAQAEHFSQTHENVIANLADIYSQTISTLKPKIIVNGEQNHLSNPDNTNKIRALLLAAVRSAVLWRQCGGKRWQILIKRAAFLDEAKKLLQQEPRVLH